MNETLKTIHSLHSTHGDFSDRQVSTEDVETILAASVRAANAGNLQSYAIIVSRDAGLMKEVCGYQASVILVYCVDVQRNLDVARHFGVTYTINPAWAMMSGVADAVLAAQTAVIAARSLRIDSLISDGVQCGDVKRFWTFLDLPPRNVYPVLAVYLGYAVQREYHRKGRLSEPGVIHRGRYQHRNPETLEVIINAADTPGFGGPTSNWHEKGFGHYLESIWKGWKGGGGEDRFPRGYGGLESALAAAGIRISAVDGGLGTISERQN